MICLFSCFLSDQSLILSYSRYSLYLLKGGRCDDIGRHFRLLGNARPITCVLLVTWTWSPDSSLFSLLSWVWEWISLENTDVSLHIVNHLSLHPPFSFCENRLCLSQIIKKLNSTERGALFWHFCVSKVITTAHAHKSGVIFHFLRAFKQKKLGSTTKDD